MALLELGVGPDDLRRSLPTSTSLRLLPLPQSAKKERKAQNHISSKEDMRHFKCFTRWLEKMASSPSTPCALQADAAGQDCRAAAHHRSPAVLGESAWRAVRRPWALLGSSSARLRAPKALLSVGRCQHCFFYCCFTPRIPHISVGAGEPHTAAVSPR